ncbi:MAG: hypothetical protein ACYDBJ_01080 [Aggregatilineales bacterium]
MMHKIKIARIVGVMLMVAVVAIAAIGFGVTAANAQTGGGNGKGDGAIRNAGIQVAKALFDAVEQATGLTQQQLVTELDGTKTLTDIVTEHNADPATVQAAAKTTLTDAINAAVTAGKLTQAQADKLIAHLDPLLGRLMNRKFNLDHKADRIQHLLHGVAVNALIQQTAQSTKLTPRQIVQDLNGGHTLAQIAQANNADVNQIVSATTTDLTNRINKLVTAGKLTQDQATKLINALPTSLAQIMNQPNPLQGSGHGQSGAANSNSAATPAPSGTDQPTAQSTAVPTDAATPSLNAA